MRKIVLIVFFIFNSLPLFSQSIEDTALVNKINKDFQKCKLIADRYDSKINKAQEQRKLFKYNFVAINVDDYVYRPYYDSLVLKKHPDSTIIKNSLLYFELDGIKYTGTVVRQSGATSYYFKGYKDNKPIVILSCNDDYYFKKEEWKNYFRKEDFVEKEIFTYSFKENNIGESFPVYYTYTKYDRVPNESLLGYINQFDSIVYSKIIENETSKERFYKKDFPLSEDEILKLLPNRIYYQAPKLMKDKYFIRVILRKDEKGNIIDGEIDTENKSPFNKQDAKNLKDVIEASLKRNENKTRIDKVYVNDSIPAYIVTLGGYTFQINPKNGDIFEMNFNRLTNRE